MSVSMLPIRYPRDVDRGGCQEASRATTLWKKWVSQTRYRGRRHFRFPPWTIRECGVCAAPLRADGDLHGGRFPRCATTRRAPSIRRRPSSFCVASVIAGNRGRVRPTSRSTRLQGPRELLVLRWCGPGRSIRRSLRIIAAGQSYYAAAAMTARGRLDAFGRRRDAHDRRAVGRRARGGRNDSGACARWAGACDGGADASILRAVALTVFNPPRAGASSAMGQRTWATYHLRHSANLFRVGRRTPTTHDLIRFVIRQQALSRVPIVWIGDTPATIKSTSTMLGDQHAGDVIPADHFRAFYLRTRIRRHTRSRSSLLTDWRTREAMRGGRFDAFPDARRRTPSCNPAGATMANQCNGVESERERRMARGYASDGRRRKRVPTDACDPSTGVSNTANTAHRARRQVRNGAETCSARERAHRERR